MTTIRYVQGLRSIGGTVVEIATRDVRCLFDFGLEGSSEMDRRVKLRPHAMVSDLIKTGALPGIPGLYDRAELGSSPLAAFGEAGPQPFVLISHMHIDHMGALGMLAEGVEVYMTEESLRLYQGLCKIGDVFYRPHANVLGIRPMAWVSKRSIAFRMIPVDHDVPGACGFEILTPDGRICYTGDLRLHGFRGADTLSFAALVKGADVCVTEGVTVSFIDDFDAVRPDCDLSLIRTESAVLEETALAVQATRGLVFWNGYNRNLLRIQALRECLQRAGRQLVLEPETARLVHHCCDTEPLPVYEPLDSLRDGPEVRRISREALQRHPERYVLQLSYENLLETLDFAPDASLYIHSNGVPLGAYDPSYERLQDFLRRRGIAYAAIGCGGHAEPAHLKYLLETIAPKNLVPLHSLRPEKIRIAGSRQVLPEPGECHCLRNGELAPLQD